MDNSNNNTPVSEETPLINEVNEVNESEEQNSNTVSRGIRRRKTKLTNVEKILLSIIFFLSLFICIFGLITVNSNKSSAPEPQPEVCLRPECILTSARIINSMDTSVDPCDDFYQFTCGNWMKQNVIPEDKTRISTFDSIFKNNINILRNALESEYKPNPDYTKEEQEIDKKIFTDLKNIYDSCMNTESIDLLDKKPMIKLINDLQIGENLEDYKDVDKFTSLLTKFHKMALSNFFNVYISADQKDPDTNVIYLSQSGLGLPSKEYYEEDEIVDEYRKTIKQMFVQIFNVTEDGTPTESIISFEKELAKVTIPSQDMQDPKATYNEYTIETLNSNFSGINWNNYFKELFDNIDIKDDTIKNDTLVIVDAPSFFEGLSKIINEASTETLSAYSEWHVIKTYSQYLSDELQQPLKRLRKVLTGAQIDPPRYEYCVRMVDRSMGMAASKMFINEAFAGDSKVAAEKTIEYIKDAMNFRIPQMKWLDRQTRNLAIKKVFSLTNKIGYPDFVMKPEKVQEEYENLKIVEGNYFENAVNIYNWLVEKNFKDIEKKVDRSRWEMTPQTVNAYYNPPMNEIVFPAGILQSPFFSAKDPYYLNYGGIGAVVGHELTHAFDNNGRQYDSKGRLNDWWSNSTLEEFTKLTQCFIDQYESFAIKDKKGKQYYINGKLTLGENLADNGGLARAYEAWKIALKKDEEAANHNEYLPGLSEYTFDQLFYISFGQIWCSKDRPESAIQRIRTDPHSPPRFRVIGAVSNSQHFSETFKCPPKSPMNPEKKCLIW